MSDEAYAEIADLRNRLGDAESQNQALQERIEELEGILRAWRIDVPRPTQETDPPRDKVFDQARVLAGLPPKPPQETDPDAVNGG
jgi:hypothetical protein